MNTAGTTPPRGLRSWWSSGSPVLWLSGGSVAVGLLLVAGLIVLLAIRGLGHFWPAEIVRVSWTVGGESYPLLAEFRRYERFTPVGAREPVRRWLLHTGNRDRSDASYLWIRESQLQVIDRPATAVRLERTEWGPAIGYLAGVADTQVDPGLMPYAQLQGALQHARMLRRSIAEQRSRCADRDCAPLRDLIQQLNTGAILLRLADGTVERYPLATVVDAQLPNQLTDMGRCVQWAIAVLTFLTEDPREANTEGGILPAIAGTVILVMLMTVLVTPFGVLAAVYLHEYAKSGPLVTMIRIAVNNLAGVPSIVFGVFGLGFFVYFLGGAIDQTFFSANLPAPVFGTPGLIWAALTLALLTVPVVIVSTEEGLARIPRNIRDGSMALGATRAETLIRVVIPMAGPSILTGVMLAIARAAGEVAPLMLVGVVKLAPNLPVDGEFPFLHLERKFMHLGFHIYDVGYQSPNTDASQPLVYATALLLIFIVLTLNLAALLIRNRLEGRARQMASG